jgi:hypothetical protein
MEEHDSWVRMGISWKQKRSGELYPSANKMHSFLSDCACLGSFLSIGGGSLRAGCEGKHESKGED